MNTIPDAWIRSAFAALAGSSTATYQVCVGSGSSARTSPDVVLSSVYHRRSTASSIPTPASGIATPPPHSCHRPARSDAASLTDEGVLHAIVAPPPQVPAVFVTGT